jgi:tRNA pseudouridine55 synthase
LEKQNLHTTPFAEGAMLLVDKPLTWTSFQTGNKIKWLLNHKIKKALEEAKQNASVKERKHLEQNAIKKIKIGHCGTLDPLATGLLIFCTGKWTKKLGELQGHGKEYTGTITLGSTTASYDLESVPENFQDTSHITKDQIVEATKNFMGEIQQLPPMASQYI